MSDYYDYIRAIVSADGRLRWEYKLHGLFATGMTHDENVQDYTDEQIKALTVQMLSVQPSDRKRIEVLHD